MLRVVLLPQFAHIAVTLFYAPAHIRFHPTRWTILLWGNIAGTLFPNVARYVLELPSTATTRSADLTCCIT